MSNVSSLCCKSLIFVRLAVFLNVQCIIFCRINWHWLAASLATQLPFHFKKDIRCITFFGNTCQWDKTFKRILALIIGEYILEDFSQFESLLLAEIGTGWFPICISQVIVAKPNFEKWNIVLHFVICPCILLFSAFTKVSE